VERHLIERNASRVAMGAAADDTGPVVRTIRALGSAHRAPKRHRWGSDRPCRRAWAFTLALAVLVLAMFSASEPAHAGGSHFVFDRDH
jgi:hypothetical protein